MLTNYYLKSEKSGVNRILSKLKDSITTNNVWRPIEDIDFVFLCGANRSKTLPSKRRESLIDFASKNLPNTKFFLAEKIFDILIKEGHKGNILDIESELSQFADHVIIILESESAFCELGAFTNSEKLRDKIIIINNSNHKESKSFINNGPIQAIKEVSGEKNLLFYKMEANGRYQGDGIGEIFSNLHTLLDRKPKVKRTRIKDLNPSEYFTKNSIRFVHDLIYFSSPISFIELQNIIKFLFGKCKDKDLNKHLGILSAIGEIKRNDNKTYTSVQNKQYFEYDKFDEKRLICTFKNMYFKFDSKRFA